MAGFLEKFGINYHLKQQMVKLFKQDDGSLEFLKKDIISLHIKLRKLRESLAKEENLGKRASLKEAIEKTGIQKKNQEEKLIKLVCKEFCYFGVAVDLNELDKGLEILLIPWANIQNHLLNIGTTRVGKTKFMLSNIRQAVYKGDNLIVIDPKGGIDQEIIGSLINFCMQSNRLKDFFYINPALPDNSLKLNPLYGMEDDEVSSLITTLIYPTTTPDNEFFGKYIMVTLNQVLSALTLLDMAEDEDGKLRERAEEKEVLKFIYNRTKYLIQQKIITGIKVTQALKQVQDRILQISKEEEKSIVRIPRSLITLKEIAQYLMGEQKARLFERVKSLSIQDSNGMVRENIKKKKEEVIQLFNSTATISEEFHNKIAVSLISWINSFSTGTLGEIFCTTRINPLVQRIYGKDTGLILLIHPLPLRFKKLSEDINKMIMKMLETSYGLVSLTGRAMGKKRTHLHFDEGESVMYVGLESVLNKMAGLGGSVYIYTQSFADIDYRLSEVISKIAQDSLNTPIIMKVNDPTSVEKAVKLMGTKTETIANFLQSDGGISSSYTKETKTLIKEDDVIKLGVGEAYIRNSGKMYKVCFPEMTEDMRLNIIIEQQKTEKSYENLVNVERSIINATKDLSNPEDNKELAKKMVNPN